MIIVKYLIKFINLFNRNRFGRKNEGRLDIDKLGNPGYSNIE